MSIIVLSSAAMTSLPEVKNLDECSSLCPWSFIPQLRYCTRVKKTLSFKAADFYLLTYVIALTLRFDDKTAVLWACIPSQVHLKCMICTSCKHMQLVFFK